MENNVEEPCSFYFADPADVGLVDDGHVEPAESIEESVRSRFDFERDVSTSIIRIPPAARRILWAPDKLEQCAAWDFTQVGEED